MEARVYFIYLFDQQYTRNCVLCCPLDRHAYDISCWFYTKTWIIICPLFVLSILAFKTSWGNFFSSTRLFWRPLSFPLSHLIGTQHKHHERSSFFFCYSDDCVFFHEFFNGELLWKIRNLIMEECNGAQIVQLVSFKKKTILRCFCRWLCCSVISCSCPIFHY